MTYLGSLYCRRTREDVLSELPGLVDIVTYGIPQLENDLPLVEQYRLLSTEQQGYIDVRDLLITT